MTKYAEAGQDSAPSSKYGQASRQAEMLAERQLGEFAAALPFFLFFYVFATIAVSLIVQGQVPQNQLTMWQALNVSTSALLVWSIYRLRRNAEANAVKLARYSPLVALPPALAWSIPLLVFVPFVSLETARTIFGIALTVMAMGIVGFLRLPRAAIIFTTLMTVALAASALGLVTSHSILAAMFTLVCGATLVAAILVQHRRFKVQTNTEAELARQNMVIKLLLNDFERDTSDWLFETNARGNLSYFSPRLAELVGLQPNELKDVSFVDLLSAIDRAQATSTMQQLMVDQKDVIDLRFNVNAAGIEQHWQITARPIHDMMGHFQGYRGVGRDISMQVKHELEIGKAKDEAVRANTAKSQFLAVISHELRTPINAIVGFTEVLNNSQSESLPAASRHEYLTTVRESAKHLQGLINDILDATRIERGAMQLNDQQNDVAELIETAVKICRDQASRNNISIVAHLVDDVLVNGDLTRLKQVILNLVANAIKFSPAGGVVNIEMTAGPERQLFVSIRDAGIGIKSEDVERVFEPFVQADEGSTRKFGGMGLGLSIARKIARLHGGDVTLTAAPGSGTEACIIMPSARVRWPQPVPKKSTSVAA